MSSTMEVTSSSSSREIRKIRKPLMERKRRARINDSLDALQRLLSEAEGLKDLLNRQTRLEKADILEITVHHLQNLNRQQKSKNQSQCGCNLATKVNNQNNNSEIGVTTTTPNVFNNIVDYSKGCAATPELRNNGLSFNVTNYSRHISRDDSSFSGMKTMEKSQFSKEFTTSDEENSQFSNRYTSFDVENPQFSNKCMNFDEENSQFFKKRENFDVENPQFYNKRSKNCRDNYENIDPSPYRVVSSNNCVSPVSKNTTENLLKNSGFANYNFVIENSTDSFKNLLGSSRVGDDFVLKNSNNSFVDTRNFLRNSGPCDDLMMKTSNSLGNEQKILENSDSSDCFEMRNSNSVENKDSLSFVPVKLHDGTLAFIVPRDVERRFFDEKNNRVLNNNGVSVSNDVRNNNRVPQNCQNVWRPWF